MVKKKKEIADIEPDYSLNDLLEFIDQLKEVAVLQLDTASKGFKPHGRDWLKTYIVAKYSA